VKLPPETAAPLQPRAALAVEGSEGTLEPLLWMSRPRRCTWKLKSDTTGSLVRQPFIHTSNGRLWQEKRHSAATLRAKSPRAGKLSLTVRFYCDMQGLRGGIGFSDGPLES
jgi:hypothetical protein